LWLIKHFLRGQFFHPVISVNAAPGDFFIMACFTCFFFGYTAKCQRPNVKRPNVERPNVEHPNVERPNVEHPNVDYS
jgi:hypothetical protein